MNKATKIIFPVIAGLILISSCTDKTTVSAFDDILNNPPFNGLTDSIQREPKNDDLYFRRAVLLNSKDYPEPSLLDFQKAWSLKKEEKYAFGISTLLLEKKPDSAILFLNEALKSIPNSLLLNLALARAYNEQGQPDNALAICDAILKSNQEQVDVLKMKADLFIKKGKEAEATAILEKAYQLTPYDVELNHLLALHFAETKNPKVILLCDSLIRADSLGERAEPYYYKGIYYDKMNNKTKAISLFDEAIRHDYTFLESYIEKGSLLYEMKNYTEALKVLNLVLNVSPDYADTYYWIAKCQEAMGQKDEALLNYQRAYGLDKEMIEAKEAAEKLTK
ncbi:MAG: tetratricopeptide repeat protein [Chitinophagaceae bacterium]